MSEYRFDTPEPVQLYVENGSGLIDVTASDVTTTEVRVEGRNADQVQVVHDRGQISVIAPKHRGIFGEQKLEMYVIVPTDSSLVVKSGSADVLVSGQVAATKIKSGSGDVTLERVTGAGSIDTGSGDVSLTESLDQLKIRSGSGDFIADRLGGMTSVSSGSGDIRVEHAAAAILVKTGSGDLEINRAEDDVTMTTGSGDTTIRTATRGRITSKGASGDLRIGVPSGTPVWTDITTVSGTVSSGLEGVGEPEPGADYIEVRATTVSGDVHLVPA